MNAAYLRRLASFALVVFMTGPFSLLVAQSGERELVRGRVIGQDSLPVVGAQVRLTVRATDVSLETRTDRRGRFVFVVQGSTGNYRLRVLAFGHAPADVSVRRAADEDVLSTTIVLEAAPVVLSAVEIRVMLDSDDPGAGIPPVGVNALVPPADAADPFVRAATLPGLLHTRDTEGTSGLSVLGLPADQSVVTMGGLRVPAGSIPRDGATATVSASPADPSRGGFSGAVLGLVPRAGTNIRVRQARISFDHPALQFGDPVAAAFGREFHMAQVSGLASGPFKRDRAFYFLSWQGGKRVAPTRTLLDNDPQALLRLGLAPDSIAKLGSLASAMSIPFAATGRESERNSVDGTLLLNLNWSPTARTTTALTLSGRLGRVRGSGIGPRGTAAYGADEHTDGASLLWTGSTYAGGVLLEGRAGWTRSASSSNPYFALPDGRVTISSRLPDGTSAVGIATVGSPFNAERHNRTETWEAQHDASWVPGDARHRIRITLQARGERAVAVSAANRYGTLSFNSLDDFATGRAASFSRRPDAARRANDAVQGSAAIGDQWRVTPRLNVQLGARVDGVHWPTIPPLNPLVLSRFALRTNRAPDHLAWSPRLGLTWAHGRLPGATSEGQARGTVRVSVGRFVAVPGATLMSGAFDATGLANGARVVYCVGDGVPDLNWPMWSTSDRNIPSACRDGGTGVASRSTPRVSTIAPDWRPPSSWRAQVGWSTRLNSRLSVNGDAIISNNLNQGSMRDRNALTDAQFLLNTENGRPVYAALPAVVPTSGAIALMASRYDSSFAQVHVATSDAASRSAQLTIGLAPVAATVRGFAWNVSWTTLHVRERQRGTSGLAGIDPTALEWYRGSGDITSQFNVQAAIPVWGLARLSLFARAETGRSFTPLVSGDINGDGVPNDRAFVLDPAMISGAGSGGTARDSANASRLRQLLHSGSSAARRCLSPQVGTLTRRNACRAPWNVTLNATMTVAPALLGLPERATITLALANPLAAADALLHGSRRRGWGDPPAPDATLLYVRGFDAQRRKFLYEVNPRFGETRGARNVPATPTWVTMEVKVALGASAMRQAIGEQVRRATPAGRTTPDTARLRRSIAPSAGPARVALQQGVTLRLTALQRDSLERVERRFAQSVERAMSPALIRVMHGSGRSRAADVTTVKALREAQVLVERARVSSARTVRLLLSDAQRRLAKAPLSYWLDPLYEAQARDALRGWVPEYP